MQIAPLFIALLLTTSVGSESLAHPVPPSQPPPTTTTVSEHVILFVLEGVDQQALKTGSMSVFSRLVRDGAATWSAESITAPRRLPAMASLLMGLPVDQHGITWNAFEFSRGYPRPPTLFDYLDLSGGRDSAIFFMDESLYQLAKPEPYTDYQMCGPLKPECSPERVVSYIRQYFRKAMSGQGYGHAILGVPHLLVVHLPAGARAGAEHGWHSARYHAALRSADRAMGSVLDIYRDHGLLSRTTIFVTALTGTGGTQGPSTPVSSRVPWIASGVGIKAGYAIQQPVSIIDTAATVMRSLGLHTHTEWDSRVVEEVFRDTSGGSALPTKGR